MNIYTFNVALQTGLASKGIVLESLQNEPMFKAWFVAHDPRPILNELKPQKLFCESYQAGGGWVIVLADKQPDNSRISPILESLGVGGFAVGLHNAFFSGQSVDAPKEKVVPNCDTITIEIVKDFDEQIAEALDGMAVPDGALQPQDGVKMLQKALDAPTKAGITLKQALKKAGISWNITDGKHLIVFSREGQEQWRVEPFSLADSKVFEETLSALWSIANGKAPNARTLDHEAKKLAAQQARDAESEISDLVKNLLPQKQPAEANVATR